MMTNTVTTTRPVVDVEVTGVVAERSGTPRTPDAEVANDQAREASRELNRVRNGRSETPRRSVWEMMPNMLGPKI